MRVGAASRSAFLASMGLDAARNLRGHFLGSPSSSFKRRSRVRADSRAQCLAGGGMAEAVGERASAIGRNSQNKARLPQVRDFEPAAARRLRPAQRRRSKSGARPFLSRKVWWSRALTAHSWGHTGDAKSLTATEPSRTRLGHKTLINCGVLRYKSVPLNPVEYGLTRLRIWGSGVRIPPSAPNKTRP